MAHIKELFDEKEVKDFESMFPTVLKDLWDDISIIKNVPESLARLQKNLEYNVPYHIKLRGFMVPFVYKHALKSTPSESQYHLAKLLGWVVQIHTSLIALVDDMYDDTEIRYWKKSWWYLNKKDMACVNDTFLVEHATFRLLEKYLETQPILFNKIIKCLNNVWYQYLLGESMEMELAKNVDQFTMDRYMAFQGIVLSRDFFSSYFEIPLWLAGNEDERLLSEIREICNDVGYIWSVTDDLTDSFGDKKRLGAMHDNDIRRGSITWLIVKAKELCDEEQWQKLRKNFGRDDNECVERVKGIYEDLGVPDICRQHLNEKQEEVMGKIRKIEERGNPIAKPLRTMAICYANLDE